MSQGNQKNQNFAATIIKERPQLDPGFLELEVGPYSSLHSFEALFGDGAFGAYFLIQV